MLRNSTRFFIFYGKKRFLYNKCVIFGLFNHFPIMRFIVVLFSCALFQTAYAIRSDKSSEVGVFAGISYYTGELNPNGHFRLGYMHPVVGGLFRQNFNKRWSLRLVGSYGRVSGSDSQKFNGMQRNRGVNFRSSITELSGQVEFNFLPFSAADDKTQPYTPFIFAGLGAFRFNPKGNFGGLSRVDLRAQHIEGKSYSKISLTVPFGIGFKFMVNQRVFLTLDYGLRKTFTDYIDDVSTTLPETKVQRGDSQSKDWYAFAGATLSIRIGKKYTSCEFDQGQNKRNKRKHS